MKGLKKGDLVIMHTCGESLAPKNKGRIWVCKTDEYVTGEKPYEQQLVFLEGFSGSFATKYLEKINAEQNVNSVPGLRQFVNGAIYDHERLVLSYEQAGQLMQGIQDVESNFYKAMHETLEENRILANQLGKLMEDMKAIYELSAEDGISKKLDKCYVIASKYVQGVFS